MSDIENSTTEVAKNVQKDTKTPSKSTPSKRLTSFERARIESEELLKALGGSLEGGRRTRSSARGPSSTPLAQTPTKRTRPATPRRGKNAKLANDDVDSGNNNQEENSSKDETQATQTESSAQQSATETDKPEENAIDKMKIKKTAAAKEDDKKIVERIEPIEVDRHDNDKAIAELVSDVKSAGKKVVADRGIVSEKKTCATDGTVPNEKLDGKAAMGFVESSKSSKCEPNTAEENPKSVDGTPKSEQMNSVESVSSTVDSTKGDVEQTSPAITATTSGTSTSDPKTPVEKVSNNESKGNSAFIVKSISVKLSNDVKATAPAHDVAKVQSSVASNESEVPRAPSEAKISGSSASATTV